MRLRKGSGARLTMLLVMGVAVAGGTGCNAIVGVGDYVVVDAGAGGVDASVTDSPAEAAVCTKVTMTPLPSQGGAGCMQDSDGSTCWPHDTTSFAATWVQPLGPHLGACTATQISDYFTACQAMGSTTQTCQAWTQIPANATCFGCLETPSTSSAYGAIIVYPNVNLDEVNIAGCIALAEPCNQPCAAAMLAQLQCENAACTSPFCGDFASYQSCSTAADTCADCTGFVASSDCQSQFVGTASQHPAVQVCNLTANDFQGFFTAVAAYICGN
jgi:hypothetical protein